MIGCSDDENSETGAGELATTTTSAVPAECHYPDGTAMTPEECAAFQGVTAEDAAKVYEPERVTYDTFTRVHEGMTGDEFKEVIGEKAYAKCELVSSSELAGFKTVMIDCPGEGSLGANTSFMFQNGNLVLKSQFGLGR
jgi:hypothetical protein